MQSEDKKENSWLKNQHLNPKTAIQKLFNNFGLQVSYKKSVPLFTLLGLRNVPIRTVIDIGANQGQLARYISGIFPAARIFCFEPLPGSYVELQQWAAHKGGDK